MACLIPHITLGLGLRNIHEFPVKHLKPFPKNRTAYERFPNGILILGHTLLLHRFTRFPCSLLVVFSGFNVVHSRNFNILRRHFKKKFHVYPCLTKFKPCCVSGTSNRISANCTFWLCAINIRLKCGMIAFSHHIMRNSSRTWTFAFYKSTGAMIREK